MPKIPDKILYTSVNAQIAPGNRFSNLELNEDFPVVLHNDGHVCWTITDYLLHRYRNLRRKISTIKTDSSSLSLLVQFLDREKEDFSNMHDETIFYFRDFLMNVHKKGQSSQINKHLRNTINFLRWYDHELRRHSPNKSRIIATDKENIYSQITIYEEKYTYTDDFKKANTRTRITHGSFLEESIPEIRKPIHTDTIDQLWSAIPQVCKSSFRKKRDELVLQLIEVLGARRCEFFRIQLPECKKAIETGVLNIHTAKSGKDRRDISVSKELISRLEKYIKYVRKPIIDKAIKSHRFTKDHEYLLIGKSGDKWEIKSLNEEIRLLAKCARIDVPAHPHLWRHRKFTLLAKDTAHLDPKKQLKIIKKTGGWRNDKSPDTYIDLYNEESKAWDKELLILSKHEDVDLIRRLIYSKLDSISTKTTNTTDDINNLKNLISRLFDRAQNN